MDKESCFEIIREHLEAKQFIIDNKREISYGIQFEIIHELERGIFRIYEGKKGIRLDSSQIRHAGLRESIERIIKSTMAGKSNIIGATDVGLGNDRINKPLMAAKEAESVINVVQDPKQIIGIDESGKGDYFGPLVIAGVYTDEKTGPQLKHAGVADSKKITDNRIRELAMFIKDTCPYDIVVIENERYNDLYSAIKNLNRLLAWGHARVIENLLERVHCEHALSDQFGRPELIQKALMTKGKQIRLEQRPRAEENISVAAASILARDEFVSRIDNLECQFQLNFPKGASSKVIEAAQIFIQQFGRESIKKVAKIHFKITDQLI